MEFTPRRCWSSASASQSVRDRRRYRPCTAGLVRRVARRAVRANVEHRTVAGDFLAANAAARVAVPGPIA